jgi:hypothetical protein
MRADMPIVVATAFHDSCCSYYSILNAATNAVVIVVANTVMILVTEAIVTVFADVS